LAECARQEAEEKAKQDAIELEKYAFANMTADEKKEYMAKKVAEKKAALMEQKKQEVAKLKAEFVEAKKRGDAETCKRIMAQLKK